MYGSSRPNIPIWSDDIHLGMIFASLPIRIVIVFVTLIFIIYLRSRERSFFFNAFDKFQQTDKWIGHGEFRYDATERAFTISNIPEGIIYSEALTWRNYRFSFEFKIINSCLGWIIRAMNPANYVMLQCGVDRIRPHIKLNGMWLIPQPHEEIIFSAPLSLDNWYTAIITIHGRTARIIIRTTNEIVFDRQWQLPESGSFLVGGIPGITRRRGRPTEIRSVIPVILDYGTIGFRNHGAERGLVRNVLVEKI